MISVSVRLESLEMGSSLIDIGCLIAAFHAYCNYKLTIGE